MANLVLRHEAKLSKIKQMWNLQMVCSKFAMEVNLFFRPVPYLKVWIRHCVTYPLVSHRNHRRSYNPGQNCWDISMQFPVSRHAKSCPKGTISPPPPLPTPGAMLFWPNSSSVHFLCYHKQYCKRGGGNSLLICGGKHFCQGEWKK